MEPGPLAPPADDEPVVIVGARTAWPLYRSVPAYVCQNKRFFQPTRRMGFYSDRTIYGAFPLVLGRFDDVEISPAGAAARLLSPDPEQQAVGRAVQRALTFDYNEGLHTVFLLTAESDPRTLTRSPLHHPGASAFTMRQRYARLSDLLAATDTEDLRPLRGSEVGAEGAA